MGLAKTTLVLVSLGFFASAAAQTCRNGTRPASETKREGCDYYCWNTQTSSWDKYFFGDNEPCFYNSGLQGICKNGECHVTDDPGVLPNTDEYPAEPTEKPKKNKKKSKKTKKPKKSKKSKDN
uniref:Basic tail protein n=1 Tax=Ixodes ricinus TaxID=34613 RepID=V5H456_IXORI